MDEQWCGSLHVGLTTLAPPELPSCPLSGLTPSLPQLRSKVTWLLCGSEVQRNGALQRQNYCCSLDRLTVSRRAVPTPPATFYLPSFEPLISLLKRRHIFSAYVYFNGDATIAH